MKICGCCGIVGDWRFSKPPKERWVEREIWPLWSTDQPGLDNLCEFCNDQYATFSRNRFRFGSYQNTNFLRAAFYNDSTLVEFLSYRLHKFADRIRHKKPITRCEALLRRPRPERCPSYFNRVIDGRNLCGHHSSWTQQGSLFSFAQTDRDGAWQERVLEFLQNNGLVR